MKLTKQQAQDFLINKKVYVNGKSEEIQKKLFECGFKWRKLGADIFYSEELFLFIHKNKYLSHSSNMKYFHIMNFEEITPEEILSIELIEEPKLKPFDKVLVRNSDNTKWRPSFFQEYYGKHNYPFFTITGGHWLQCIPYEGNEHLLNNVGSPE